MPEKKIYSHLNMEDVTGAEHTQAQRVCKDFGIKNIEEYHDLYVHSNALVLADAVENVKICVLKCMSLTSQNLFQLLD